MYDFYVLERHSCRERETEGWGFHPFDTFPQIIATTRAGLSWTRAGTPSGSPTVGDRVEALGPSSAVSPGALQGVGMEVEQLGRKPVI